MIITNNIKFYHYEKSYLIICIFSIFILSTSCEEENKVDDTADFDLQAKVDFFNKSSEIIINDFESTIYRGGFSELNQETIDYYLALIGEEAGSVDITFVNEIVDAIILGDDMGFIQLLDNYGYSDGAKFILNTLHEGGSFTDIENHSSFQSSTISEKETILLVDAIFEGMEVQERGECGWAILGGVVAGGLIGGDIGALIGGLVGVTLCVLDYAFDK